MEYETVEQVAERLQVSPWTIRRWLRDGELEGSNLGDRAGWRIPSGAVERVLEAKSNRGNETEKGKAAA